MPFFKSKDSRRIYYECHDFNGERPVVVFLNGTTQTTRSWWLQTRHLKNRFRILLYDARGPGQSDLGQAGLTLDRHIDDLIKLLDQDLIVQTKQSRALAKLLGAHLMQLKGVGHTPNLEAPEAFNQVIRQFLAA